jgi:hypothetical protein
MSLPQPRQSESTSTGAPLGTSSEAFFDRSYVDLSSLGGAGGGGLRSPFFSSSNFGPLSLSSGFGGASGSFTWNSNLFTNSGSSQSFQNLLFLNSNSNFSLPALLTAQDATSSQTQPPQQTQSQPQLQSQLENSQQQQTDTPSQSQQQPPSQLQTNSNNTNRALSSYPTIEDEVQDVPSSSPSCDINLPYMNNMNNRNPQKQQQAELEVNGGAPLATTGADGLNPSVPTWWKHQQQQQTLAEGPDFSQTLYSLASTLPRPMVISNNAVLGSVGGGLHFQRTIPARRKPMEAVHPFAN